MTNPFDEDSANLVDEREPYNESVATLVAFADSLRRQVFAGVKNVTVNVTPGFTVNMGQQYKVQVLLVGEDEKQSSSYTDILFRAYVPLDGYPTVVDLFGEEKRRCKNKQELLTALKALLHNEDFKMRLRSLKTLAVHQTTGA